MQWTMFFTTKLSRLLNVPQVVAKVPVLDTKYRISEGEPDPYLAHASVYVVESIKSCKCQCL